MKIICFLFCWFISCSLVQRGQEDITSSRQPDSEKILIVYLSRTNNTKAVAELIQKEVGGDLVALELEKPYPENYGAIVKQVAEENETGYLPPLKTKIDLNKYETVFLGFPTWGMQLPPPIKSFLAQNDFKDRVIVPFNTHAGYGVGSGFRTVKELCPGSTVLEGLSIKGGIERDGVLLAIQGEKKEEAHITVKRWLEALGIRNTAKP